MKCIDLFSDPLVNRHLPKNRIQLLLCPVYSQVALGRTSNHSGLKVFSMYMYIKYLSAYICTGTSFKKKQCINVVLLNFCVYISTVNQTQVAPSICDDGVALYFSDNINLK